ncbi:MULTISPECIES: hypothetical protein [Nitrosomonas]|uniref:hypothetical protein n=1 Tax=Nitrosomonas TaxID=914 RepID=UPI0023F1F19D|nr:MULTISPECIES: hypothetical protein [Nitrosomonas]
MTKQKMDTNRLLPRMNPPYSPAYPALTSLILIDVFHNNVTRSARKFERLES